MTWRFTFELALTSVRRRAVRTLLAVLGVALGSALLVALGSVASVAESRAVEHLGQGLPVGALKVAPARPGVLQLSSDEFQGRGAHAIDNSTVHAVTSLPGVSAVLPIQAAPVLAVPPTGSSYEAAMIGTAIGSPGLPVTVVAGRLPAPGALDEVAVAPSYVDRAHPGGAAGSAIGDQVTVVEPKLVAAAGGVPMSRWFRATVVGVVDQQFAQADLLVPLQQTELAHAWQGVDEGDYDPDSPYQQLIVLTSGIDQVHRVRSEVYELGYATAAPEHVLGAVLRYLHVVDIVLAGIGAVAVAISALSVGNALLAAVRERRREIGVLKAIGARDADVLRWFLFEAGIVGLSGGVAGTLAGAAMALTIGAQVQAYLVDQGLVLEPLRLSDIPFPVLAAGVFGSGLLALVAGVLPALHAARLPTREAIGSL
jgi:ABC-type antimicrobial peptide transport system permease subunit